MLKRILTLSKDLRFAELCKVLESYGYEITAPKAAAVIILFERLDATDTIPKHDR